MRKSFLTKAIVAVGVLASALALSSVAVFAAGTNTIAFTHGADTYTKGDHYYTSNGETLNSSSGAYFHVYLSNDRISTSTPSSTSKYLAIGSKDDAIDFTITEDTADLTLEISGEGGSNKRTATFTVPNGADAVESIEIPKNSEKDSYKRTLNGSGKYSFKFDGGKGPAIYKITVEEKKGTGTGYDESEFVSKTTATTAVVPSDNATNSATASDVISAATESAVTYEGANSEEIKRLGAETTVDSIVFGEGIVITNNQLTSYGKTQKKAEDSVEAYKNNRYIKVSVKANDVIKVLGTSSTDTSAKIALSTDYEKYDSNKIVAENSIGSDTSLTVPETFTDKTDLYIVFSANIFFTGVEIYPGVEVTAPQLTLTFNKKDTENGRVIYKGSINGTASDKLPVKTIKIVVAEGYDKQGDKINAKSADITNVYITESGDAEFLFAVTDDGNIPTGSFKLQGQLTYENGAKVTSVYSDVLGYNVEA